jgi:hypothetical protein
MRCDRHAADLVHDLGEEGAYGARIAVADRVGQDDLVHSGSSDFAGQGDDTLLGHGSLDRAAERRGEAAGEAWPPVGRQRLEEGRDALQVGDRVGGGAAKIGLVVALAHRQDAVQLMHAGLGSPLRSLEVGDECRDSKVRNGQRRSDHLPGIGKLRQELRRNEGTDLDLAHPGGGFRPDPVELGAGVHWSRNVLQPVAQTHFPNFDVFNHGRLASLALEHRLALFVERLHALAAIGRRHKSVIGVDFEEHGAAQIHLHAKVHRALGLTDRQGALSQIVRAAAIVSSIRVSGGHNLFTSPHASASSALKGFPVRITSLARREPMARGKVCVPPPPGMMPMVTSVSAKRALVLA